MNHLTPMYSSLVIYLQYDGDAHHQFVLQKRSKSTYIIMEVTSETFLALNSSTGVVELSDNPDVSVLGVWL